MKIMVALVLFVFSTPVLGADPCANKSTVLTAAQRKMYARSISSNLKEWRPPAQIKIDGILTEENWTAVWATPKGAEQGVFIYSQEKSGLVFHDVWAGRAIPPDKPDIVRWVKQLSPSAPDSFAKCFAETVTAGH